MGFRKTVVLIITFALCVPLLGFTLPQLAVLEAILAAGIDPTVGPLVTSKIEEEFVKSGKYRVLDRANVEQTLQEKEFQLSSGIVRNEEIRQAGEYLGADFVIVANVSRVGQTFVVAAKMIDVVSGEIAAQTSHEQQGRIDVLLDIARVVGGRLAGTELVLIEEEEPEPEEEPAEVEVTVAPKVEPVEKPPRERKPVEFKRFVAGAKAGGNLANARTDTWFDWYYLDFDDSSLFYAGHYSDEWPYAMFGLTAGAYFVLNLNNYLGVQVELLYSQKGYRYDFNDYQFTGIDLGLVTNLFRFSYVEIPLLVKARLPGRFSPYAVAGASIAILLSATVENIYENSAVQATFDTLFDNPADLKDFPAVDLNTLDAGIVAGAGIDILVGSILINLEARYTLGLLAVSNDVDYTNGAFSFTGGVGYQF
jgi:TolB-like protein